MVPGEPFIIRYSANINALKLSCETVALQVDTSVRLKNSSEIVESSFFVLVQDPSAPKIDLLSTRYLVQPLRIQDTNKTQGQG